MRKQLVEKVGVCIAMYNAESWIEECIDSIRAQTYKNIEIYIQDDASTDYSWDRAYGKGVTKLFSNPNNRGWAKTLNSVVRKACNDKCKYVHFMGADDLLEPDCIEKMVKEIQKGYDWVNCYLQKFGANNDVLTCEENVTVDRLLQVNPLTHFALIKNWVWTEMQGFDTKLTPKPLKAGFEDWEMWIRLIKAGKKYSVIKEPLYRYRIHEKQFGDIAGQNNQMLRDIIMKKHSQ